MSSPEAVRGRRRSGLQAWLLRRGWLHLLLLTCAGLFLLPLLWMLLTSVKTDEELADPSFWPPAIRVHPASPYVRRPAPLLPPEGVSAQRWRALGPQLLAQCRTAVLVHLPAAPPVAGDAWADAAAIDLARSVIARTDRSQWQREDAVATLPPLAASDATGALDQVLARLECDGVQATTDDAQRLVLLPGPAMAAQVRVLAGHCDLVPTSDGVEIHYRTDGDLPRLALPITLPAGVPAASVHQLALPLRADGSWNRLSATVDLGGRRWRTALATPLAQTRQQSLLLQPPGADDATFRSRIWVDLVDDGPGRSTGQTGTLELAILPSGWWRVLIERARWNYHRAARTVPFWTYVGNSALLVILVVLGSLFSSAWVAYAFARLRWPGRSAAFLLLLATMMLPSQVTMVPSFFVWRGLGWYNTLNPLWVGAWLGNAFFIFLMVQQLRTIPRELEEAARIDGLNAVQTWWYVILPQLGPSLAAIAIMSFMGAWNDFLGPLIYLRDQGRFPLSLGLFGLHVDGAANDFGILMAGNVLMTLPTIVVFFCFQRYFIQGMSASGIKG